MNYTLHVTQDGQQWRFQVSDGLGAVRERTGFPTATQAALYGGLALTKLIKEAV